MKDVVVYPEEQLQAAIEEALQYQEESFDPTGLSHLSVEAV